MNEMTISKEASEKLLPIWTYSSFRATLRFQGEFFAIVTPDGRSALSPEQEKRFLNLLNVGEQQPEREKAIFSATAKLEKELFNLKNKCAICVCSEGVTDEACVSCITDSPTIFERVEKLEGENRELLEAGNDLYYAAKNMIRYKNNLEHNQWHNLENAVNRFTATTQRQAIDQAMQEKMK